MASDVILCREQLFKYQRQLGELETMLRHSTNTQQQFALAGMCDELKGVIAIASSAYRDALQCRPVVDLTHDDDRIGEIVFAPFDPKYMGTIFSIARIVAQDKVVFIHPTASAMQSCPSFVDGECKDASCLLPHGHSCSLAALRSLPPRPARWPPLINDRVLAEYTDGLWYPATIVSVVECPLGLVDDSDHPLNAGPSTCYRVHYFGYAEGGDEGVLVRGVKIAPPLEANEPDRKKIESSSGESSSSGSDNEERSGVGSFGWAGRVDEPRPSISGPEWCQHEGFGARMLHKFGFQWGQGLGARSQGTTEPIEAWLRTDRMGLAYREERTKSAGRHKRGIGRRRRKRRREGNSDTLFTTLNRSINVKPEARVESIASLSKNELALSEKANVLDGLVRKFESQARRTSDTGIAAQARRQAEDARAKLRAARAGSASIEKSIRLMRASGSGDIKKIF